MDAILNFIAQHALQFIAGGALVWAGLWIRGILVQKQKNEINDVRLEGEKLFLDNKATSLSDLVNDSNADHGVKPGPANGSAGPVVPTAGNGTSKK
jgi:hypothetical protein